MKAAKYAPTDLDIVAKAGEEDAVGRGLEAMIEPTMAEPGVKLFLPYRSPSDPRAFFIFELYIDEQGWATINGPATSRFSSTRCCRASKSASGCLMYLTRRCSLYWQKNDEVCHSCQPQSL